MSVTICIYRPTLNDEVLERILAAQPTRAMVSRPRVKARFCSSLYLQVCIAFITMSIVIVETLIKAPPDRCFDLARSADFHVASTKSTAERIVGGITSGLMKLDDVIEFEGTHFGVVQRLSAKIVVFDRPKHFRDTQLEGIFRSFNHDHYFEPVSEGTLMRDIFDFKCPLGILGKLAAPVVARHLRKFLAVRGLEIKRAAEGQDWQSFLL